jgi:hypothetical protein
MTADLVERHEGEQRGRSYLIQTLARDEEMPKEEVGRIYDEVFDELSSNARIKTFLPILVGRRVRVMLQVRGGRAIMEGSK